MIRVLLVDDEPGVLDTLRLFLEKDGKVEMDCEPSAEKALMRLSEEAFDVVVSDYFMPGMDGIELLKTLRNTGNTTPFILMTGRGREDIAMMALNEGADFYIQKTGEIVPMTSELRNMIVQCHNRDQAERAEKEARTRFDRFAKGSRDVMYRVRLRPSFAVEYITPSVEQFIGYPADDFYKDPNFMFKLVHSEDWEAVNEAIAHPEISVPVAFRCIHRDGCTIWAEDIWVPVTDDRGEIVGVDGIIRDITAHVATKEALESANSRLALLGRMIRHDALNQLMLIENTADLIARDGAGGLDEGLERVKNAAHIIRMQLEFSGLEMDGISEGRTWKGLRETVSSAVSMARPDGLSVATELEDVELPGDIVLGRVVSNMLDDTRTHGEKAKNVRIRTARTEGGIDLIYEDDGVGIPAEHKERIFERGFGKRTGYGLYLSREVLALSGITMREEGTQGEGARFVIHIPDKMLRPPKRR